MSSGKRGGGVCRPPPPRRLEMAIMLSMESMRQYCLDKNHPAAKSSRVKRSHNSFGPGTGGAREQRLAYLT